MKSHLLTKSLKMALNIRGLTYLNLAQQLGVSHTTVKRWFSSGGMSLEQFSAILQVANLEFQDLLKFMEAGTQAEAHVYSEEQESFLSKNPRTHAFYNFLIRFGSVKEVIKKTRIDQKDISRYLRQLDGLGLIEWQTGHRIRFRTSKKVIWRKNGPLRQQFLRQAKTEFIESGFTEELSSFRFLNVQLSEKSASELASQLIKISAETSQISEIERTVNPDLNDFGVMVAIRPWTFSKITLKSE